MFFFPVGSLTLLLDMYKLHLCRTNWNSQKILTIDAIWINPLSNKHFLPNALWLLKKKQTICQNITLQTLYIYESNMA